MSTPQSNIHIVCLLTSQILYDIIERKKSFGTRCLRGPFSGSLRIAVQRLLFFSLYINVSIFYFGKSYPVIHRFSVDNSVSANYNSMIKVNTSTVCKQQTAPESDTGITPLMLYLYPCQYFLLTRLTLYSKSPVILFTGLFSIICRVFYS